MAHMIEGSGQKSGNLPQVFCPLWSTEDFQLEEDCGVFPSCPVSGGRTILVLLREPPSTEILIIKSSRLGIFVMNLSP